MHEANPMLRVRGGAAQAVNIALQGARNDLVGENRSAFKVSCCAVLTRRTECGGEDLWQS
jgi:hypothetical protein